MHAGNVERAIQTLKNFIANLEDGISLTENVNRALRVMRFTLQTRLKLTPFELHYGRKQNQRISLRTENHTYLTGRSCLFQHRIDPKYLYYVGRGAEGDITNLIIMANTKVEEKHLAEEPKSSKEKKLDIPSIVLKKITTKNH